MNPLHSSATRHVDSFLNFRELGQFSETSRSHREIADQMLSGLFEGTSQRWASYHWEFETALTDSAKMKVVLRKLKELGVRTGELAPTFESINQALDLPLIKMYRAVPGADLSLLVGTETEQAAAIRAWMAAHETDLAGCLHLNLRPSNPEDALFSIPPELERYFPNLETLNLIGNQLTTIPNFRHFPRLQRLNLALNQLEIIPNFEHLPELEFLNLNHNQLMSIPDFHLPELRSLTMSSNQLTRIPRLANLVRLESLDVSNNRLTQIHSFDGCRVDLYRNLLQSIPRSLWSRLGQMEPWNQNFLWQTQLLNISWEVLRLYTEAEVLEHNYMYDEETRLYSYGIVLDLLEGLGNFYGADLINSIFKFYNKANPTGVPLPLSLEEIRANLSSHLFDREIFYRVFNEEVARRLRRPESLGPMMFLHNMLHSSRTVSDLSLLPYGVRGNIWSFLEEGRVSVEKALVDFEMPCHVEYGQSLEIRGTGRGMSWEHGIPLQWSEGDRWHAPLIEREGEDYEYKVVLRMPDGSIRWEVGENRHKDSPKTPPVFG